MTELEYQNLIRRGFRIIRTVPNMYYVQMKKYGSKGWQTIYRLDNEEQMYRKFEELLADERTIRDNEIRL